MNKDYKISNDGTIFEIKDDGSISKLAKIDDKGRVTDLEGREMKSYPHHSSTSDNDGKGWYWFLIVAFIIATIVFASLYSEANDKYYRASQERWEYKNMYEIADQERDQYKAMSESSTSLRKEINSLEQERDNAKSELSKLKNKVSAAYPLIITDIEIENVNYDGDVQTNYSNTNTIYSFNTMYLRPRIKYTGLISATKTLKIKWYKPDGTISTGTSSPYGFSQSEAMYVYNGENTYTFNGWGSSNRGHWRSGTYRIEIWYENTCLKSKTFTIY